MIKFLKEFFGFSKKELNGLLVFCILIVLVAFSPVVFSLVDQPEKYDYSAFAKEVASFRASAKENPLYKYNHFKYGNDKNEDRKEVPQLFSFNPNGLNAALWKKLGLSDRQIKTIKNYESKGGKFYRKEDLKKIYSIKNEDYILLEPYIHIPEKVYESDFKKTPFEKRIPKSKATIVVELNAADSAQLESINGIGPAFASRIIKYRNRLGGFYRKEQLREVYGLDSIVYEKLQNFITVNRTSILPILINTANFAELKKHPYLSYKQMNAILQYRKQHGLYKNLSDLRGIAILNEEVLNKIAPYLSFE